MHKDALDRHADLAGIEHRALENFGRCIFWVNVGQHDSRVVAAELERDLLESRSAGSHDLLASGSGASERDLSDLWVFNHHLPELIATSHNVHHALLENSREALSQVEKTNANCPTSARAAIWHCDLTHRWECFAGHLR